MSDAVLPSPSAPIAEPATPLAAGLGPAATPLGATYAVIFAVSFCHFLNDILQSLIAALYPMLKSSFQLDFWQIGILTLAFQGTASLLQPVVGLVTDRRPLPRSLPVGMAASLIGLLLLAFASTYPMLIVGAAAIGLGSAVFHPEASRVARAASGGRFGFAQSTFQVGGNFGTAAGPLLAAFIVVPAGQASLAGFTLVAALGIAVLWRVSSWYAATQVQRARRAQKTPDRRFSRKTVVAALIVLAVLTFSKNVYMAGISSYYTFYVIERFAVDVQTSQLLLFVFLAASAVGVFVGGPIGDRWGPKTVIWFSILGVLPFTLALPYADFAWTVALTVAIGLIMSSAFPAIVVFAQELVPGRVGLIAGIFFGFAFGMGGIGAAALGVLADHRGIEFVYWVISFLPALGLLTVFLPGTRRAATGS